MKYHDEKATQKETDRIYSLFKTAGSTPAIMIGNVDVAGSAWDDVYAAIDKAADRAGLPVTDTHYGLDPESRRFLSYD